VRENCTNIKYRRCEIKGQNKGITDKTKSLRKVPEHRPSVLYSRVVTLTGGFLETWDNLGCHSELGMESRGVFCSAVGSKMKNGTTSWAASK
jgi:hypothetical protein